MVLTGHDDAYHGIAAVSVPTHAAYAARRGYSQTVQRGGFAPFRAATWSKLLFLRHALDAAPLVLWLDADAAVTGDADLAELAPAGEAVVTVAADRNGVNAGVMLWRRCPAAVELIDRLWRMEDCVGHHWEDNAALHRAHADSPQRFRVVDKRRLNSYFDDWRPGDFVLHAAGGSPTFKRGAIEHALMRAAEVP